MTMKDQVNAVPSSVTQDSLRVDRHAEAFRELTGILYILCCR